MLAVEAGDHGNLQGGAGPLEMAQVELRTHVEEGGRGHVAEGFAVALAAHQAEVVEVELLLLQLLLKQGMEDDGGGSRLLQSPQHGGIFAEGRGRAHHEGAAQGKAEPSGGEIRLGHGVPGPGGHRGVFQFWRVGGRLCRVSWRCCWLRPVHPGWPGGP